VAAINRKKMILWVLVIFLGFWMFTDPHGLAEAAQASGSKTWDLTQDLFRALIRFFGALT
jgi:hypothetical protein